MSSFPPELRRLQQGVDEALQRYLDEALPRVTALHPSLAPLTRELHDFVTGGGKRVRPALLLTGFRAGGGTDVAAAMGPAIALELLHTWALLHDDVIDAAPSRRGRESTHLRFARQHREHGWSGEAAAYGEAVAILLGDLAGVQSDEVFLTADVAPDRLLAGFRRFTLLREEVMAGQYIDLFAAQSRATSRELALAVATYKSGRYSVARPLEIGALLAGADGELVDGLSRVGGPLGRAFQVRDDVLGVFGDEADTGKSAASDLVEGKRTLLVAETAARLPEEPRAEFDRLLGSPDLTDAGAARLRSLMQDSGGLAATLAYVDEVVTQALAKLDELAIDDEVAATLRGMAHFIRDRHQ